MVEGEGEENIEDTLSYSITNRSRLGGRGGGSWPSERANCHYRSSGRDGHNGDIRTLEVGNYQV